MLSQSSKVVENNNKGTEPLIIYKSRQVIIYAKKKAVRDYYFDLANSKPVHKHIQEWFLK